MEFEALPIEIKLHICSFLERKSIPAILSIQAVSKEFRDLLWRSRTHFELEEWENNIDPLILLNRSNPNIVTYLDFSGLDPEHQNFPSATEIISKFSALEYLRLDELPTAPEDLAQLEKAIISHKSLIEIRASINPGVPIELYRNIAKRVRLFTYQRGRSDTLDIPTFNFYDETLALYQQEESISFPTTSKLVKGITIFDKLIVGTADGTIFVCDQHQTENRYEITQTLHEHTSEITCFYYTPRVKTNFVIGAKDGKVSQWYFDATNKMTLIDTKQLPEPICHVYFSDRNFDLPFLFAASKHKVYFYVGDKLKKHGFKSEHVITGLYYDTMRQDLYIATEVDINRIPGHSLRYLETFQVQTSPHGFSNLNLSEGQSVASLTPTEIAIKPFLFQKATLVIEGKFDASNPNLLAFSPYENHITCSNGPCLLVYDLESRRQIVCVSPQISKSDLLNEKFPTCTCWLWYSSESNYLYAIFSDNRVYWWSVIHTREMDFMPVSAESDSEPEPSEDSDNEQLQESLSDSGSI